jgi:hypothetical protein
MWEDERFLALDPPAPNPQWLFIYLLTAPRTNVVPGLLRQSVTAAARTLQWQTVYFRDMLAKLEEQGMVIADADQGLFWVPKALRRYPVQTKKQVWAYCQDLIDLPQCDVSKRIIEGVVGFFALEDGGKWLETIQEFVRSQERLAQKAGSQSRLNFTVSCLSIVILEATSNSVTIRQKTTDSDFQSSPTDIAAVQSVYESWNDCVKKHQNVLAGLYKLTQDRRDQIATRLRENPDVEFWKSVFEKCHESDFLTGKNDRGWKATFDWLMKNSNNYVKVVEGRYSRTQTTPKPTPPSESLKPFQKHTYDY